MKIKRESKSR